MKINNMFRVEIPPPEPLFPNHNPNPYDDRSFDACLFHKVTVSNYLNGNIFSLTQK